MAHHTYMADVTNKLSTSLLPNVTRIVLQTLLHFGSMQVKHLRCSRKARLSSSNDGTCLFSGYIRSVGLADRISVLWSANICGYKRMIDGGWGLGRYGNNLVGKTISSLPAIMIFC